MNTAAATATERYARVIEVSRRVRWEIERDVIRGRRFDYAKTFMPDGLSLARELSFLGEADARLLSQVQGRTYAYMFGLVERFISAKVLDLGRDHSFGDQVALEAMVRMGDEEIKHQELFRRLEAQMAQDMPPGHVQTAAPNDVAHLVLGKGTWAVLALTLNIELMSQAHYRASIGPREGLSPLWKDVFLFHWREESQHAILDEMELRREDGRLDAAQRAAGVGELIELVGAIDGILQGQAAADATYFVNVAPVPSPPASAMRSTRRCSRRTGGSTSFPGRPSRASRTCCSGSSTRSSGSGSRPRWHRSAMRFPRRWTCRWRREPRRPRWLGRR